MPKIITLEKGIDGVYKTTGIEVTEKKTRQRKQKYIYGNESDIHIPKQEFTRFIANHGDKASEFLTGVTKVIKLVNTVNKFINKK